MILLLVLVILNVVKLALDLRDRHDRLGHRRVPAPRPRRWKRVA
jgi:hypothetical protein